MKQTLTFEESTHTYRLMPSGKIIPSVSTIIGSVFPFNAKGLAVERAVDLGKAVHKAIELDIKGKLDFASVDSVIMPYLNQAQEAINRLNIYKTKCQTEVFLASKKYGFAGTFDLAEKVIVDFKTGQKSIHHRLQVAAYRHLWNSNNKDKIKKAYVVYLNSNIFEPEIIEEQPQDFQAFLNCLGIYNWKGQNK